MQAEVYRQLNEKISVQKMFLKSGQKQKAKKNNLVVIFIKFQKNRLVFLVAQTHDFNLIRLL